MSTAILRADHVPTRHHAERRQHRRHRVMLSARLHVSEGQAMAVLLDISEGGALVACPLAVPRGTPVVLTRGDLRAPAIVSHVDGRRLGLVFDRPLSTDLVNAVVTPATR